MAGYGIAPLNPPLPTAMNLPFQPAVGSQTSILMSESRLGFNVAATRAECRRLRKGCGLSRRGAARRGYRKFARRNRTCQRDRRIRQRQRQKAFTRGGGSVLWVADHGSERKKDRDQA
jgi:hypothetical protein